MTNLLEVENLIKHFPIRTGLFQREKGYVHAVDCISFSIGERQTLGLAGESGCGKTTTGRLILRLIEPDGGIIRFMGKDILKTSDSEMKALRTKMQIIFQDPYASLNPRKTIKQILTQPFQMYEDLSWKEIETKVVELLKSIGLNPAELFMDRHPHELSGGQRQRVVVARAIALRPKFVVADEPVSALDMSVRAQILRIMRDLQEEFNLTCLFITHDLAVLRSMADTVAIMYLGKLVEIGSVDQMFGDPLHPYTRALLSATPVPKPRLARSRKRMILKGDVPSPIDPPKGCRFHTRCPFRRQDCTCDPEPSLLEYENGHSAACPYAREIASVLQLQGND